MEQMEQAAVLAVVGRHPIRGQLPEGLEILQAPHPHKVIPVERVEQAQEHLVAVAVLAALVVINQAQQVEMAALEYLLALRDHL